MLPAAVGFRGLVQVTSANLPRMSSSTHLNPLIHQLLTDFLAAQQLKRIRYRRFALLHAGDHVQALEPVRLGQVRLRPPRRMVRMRMVKTDNVLTAFPA